MKKFTWALVSTGRLEDGEKFYISLKGPDGEPWANPIEPEQIMQEIAALKAQEEIFALKESRRMISDARDRWMHAHDALKAENERLKQQLAAARGREATGGEG